MEVSLLAISDKKISSLFLSFSWRLKKAYEKGFESISKDLSLSQNEIDILLFLNNNPTLDTAKDICNYRVMSKSMISKSVESLSERGYILLNADQKDKRRINLELTQNAKATLLKLEEAQKNIFKTLTHGITKEEKQIIKDIFHKLDMNISKIN